jgi:hypothetical protein
MSCPSKTMKAKAFHRVYTLITHIDPTAEIERDSLHTLYEVNKHGVRVKFNQTTFRAMKNKFIAKFCAEYQLTEDTPSGCYENKDTGLALFVREQDMTYFGSTDVLIDITLY